ncbi:hypothetical protein IQ246_12450, partial [aff. Roholtiella sp. LEGE 12411]|nr:hypothetical protein [aff. Roholtiella sp. LEGE 12411]
MKNSTYKGMEFLGMGNLGPPLGIKGNVGLVLSAFAQPLVKKYGAATNAQCPMPNAQCPMPNAQCPMPNAQCPMPNAPLSSFLNHTTT